MGISRRHHYLPVFYIKGFTEANAQLWVYDKKADSIIRKSPRSIFYEWNRNIVQIYGTDVDIVETQLYRQIDDFIAAEFNKVKDTSLDVLEQQHFINYITLMVMTTFYRLPATETLADELLVQSLKQQLPTDKVEKMNQLSALPLSDADKKKIISFIAPAIHFFTSQDSLKHGKSFYKIVDAKVSCFLLSDNPIIYEKVPTTFNDLVDSFIFPLTSKRVYYGLKNGYYNFDTDILKRINLILALQAKQYFAFTEKDFLLQLIDAYKMLAFEFKSINDIAQELFYLINRIPSGT